jgi:hypothetical protein
MRSVALTCFVGLLLSTACAAEEASPASDDSDIQGGAASRSYLAVGMVRMRSGSYGTGALIRPNVVLTAGHVAIGSVERFYYGSPPPGKDSMWNNLPSVAITDKALGDCYQRAGHTPPASCAGNLDVGLVKLERPITDVTPLRMYTDGFEWLEPTLRRTPSVTAVGFGCHTLSSGKQLYGQRRWATSLFDSLTPTEVVVRQDRYCDLRRLGWATSV